MTASRTIVRPARASLTALFVAGSSALAGTASADIVRSFDFEAGGSFGGSTQVRDAAGFAGLGAEGYEISGNMLYADQKDTPITVSVSDLTAHDAVDLRFTLALIDSWDGEHAGRSWAPDFLVVRVDGDEVFRESFTNFDGERWNPSYDPGERLAYANLYGNSYKDSVYDIQISDIAHVGESALVEVFATGSGYESNGNEPFAIDNLSITTIPAPGALALLGIAFVAPRRKRAAEAGRRLPA